jgi:hypothetical protein
MKLPFTPEQFFDVIAEYNLAVWPAPLVLGLAAIAGVAAAFARPNRDRALGWVLALLWAWMAVAYHFAFFTRINSAAWMFGAAFLVEGSLFARHAWAGTLRFRLAGKLDAIVGVALLAYAVGGYALVAAASGQTYPRVPTFGLPCPTTVFTLGLLLLARRPAPASLFVVPLGWSLIGTVAAVKLDVPEDYGLLVAAVLVVALLVRRSLGTGARPLGAVLRRLFVHRLKAEARARGHEGVAESFSDLALEAAELEDSAPPALRKASTAHWLSLAATAVAAYRRMLREGRPPSMARALVGAALGSLLERHVGAYLRSRFGAEPRGVERLLEDFFAWCCTKELLPLFRELMPETAAARTLGRFGGGHLASWPPGDSHPPHGGMSASSRFR